MNITVTGGEGGITAHIDDLHTMAALLHAGAVAVADTAYELNAPALRAQLAGDHTLAGLELNAALDGLVNGFGPLTLAAAHLDGLASELRHVAAMYHHTDGGLLHSLFGAVRHLIGAQLRFDALDFGGAEDELFRALPGIADTLIATGWTDDLLAATLPDGRPVLHDLGRDDTTPARTPPRNLADLISGLTHRNSGRPGEISVSFVVGSDGRRRAIVDVPGTKSWDPLPNPDVTSVATDLRALSGRDTAYEDGIFEAITRAGVRPDEDVMLVGHSEGGILAVKAATDAHRSGRFRVTHVVTAGAPVGQLARKLPDDVTMLALENSADVVPHCDGTDNPDRPNITTVTADLEQDSIGANHSLETSYAPEAEAADASSNASIRGFTASANGFLSGTGMSTHAFVITRDP